MKKTLATMIAAVSLIAAAPAGSDQDTASYRQHYAITPTGTAPEQRLSLPAEVLATLQNADADDVRVFDAEARQMPIARVNLRATERRDNLPALPILGAPDALKVSGVSLNLDSEGRARVVQVDGKVDGQVGAAIVLGALLDARRLTGGLTSVKLDADFPAGQPVTFTIAASRDLATWRTIATKVAYRAPDDAATGGVTIAPDAALDREYLRVTWQAGSRLLSPVTVRGATLVTQSGTGNSAPTIEATLASLKESHVVDVALPFATSLSTILVTPRGNDLVVPIRVLGRDNREQPWTLLGQGIASRSAPNAITIDGRAFRTLRIEADAKSGGFTTPPAIRFAFAPAEIIFLAAGKSPFKLAAGKADASDAYLPLASLTQTPSDTIQNATLDISAAPKLVLVAVSDDGATKRQAVLWAVLLLATALLGGMGWVLWKKNARTPDAPATR